MKYLYIIILSAFISCKTEKKSDITGFVEFPAEIVLESNMIKTPPVLKSIVGLEILDDVLVGLEMGGNYGDKLLKIFSLTDFELLDSSITYGDGPKEETAISPYFKNIQSNRILYRSFNDIKIAQYSKIDSTINITKKIEIPWGKETSMQNVTLIDEKYISWDMNSEGYREFYSFTEENNEAIPFGHPNPDVGQNNDKSFITNFQKLLITRPDQELFAAIYNNYPILRIYDKNGKLKKETRFEKYFQFPNNQSSVKSSYNGDNVTANYTKIKATNNYIYALFHGKTEKELVEQWQGSNGGINDYSNIIHVYDWNGNPIKKIILDHKIFSFCVSSNDDYIIASSLEKINGFFKYQL